MGKKGIPPASKITAASKLRPLVIPVGGQEISVTSQIQGPDSEQRVVTGSSPQRRLRSLSRSSSAASRTRVSRSRSKSHHSNERGRSRSRSTKRSHRRRKRSRSESSSSSNRSHKKHRSKFSASKVEEVVRRVVCEDMQSVLAPITNQLLHMNANQDHTQSPEDNSLLIQELKEIKEKQKDLSAEQKIASLKTPGAQSQFRCISKMSVKLDSSIVKVDDLMLSQDSPEDPTYKALASIREGLAEAKEIASDRADMILRADVDPKNGWQALTLYEEKKRQGSQDKEKDKIFAECIKQVQENRKKQPSSAKTTQSYQSVSKWPFRYAPGGKPGYNNYSQGSYAYPSGYQNSNYPGFTVVCDMSIFGGFISSGPSFKIDTFQTIAVFSQRIISSFSTSL
jgi:hypothetical protein